MAKLPATVATLPSKKQKVRSEIDDIFSTASTSAVPTPSVLSKNTKKKRQLVPESKLDTAAVETGGEKPQKKRKGPETIIDSSAVIESFRNHPVPTSNNPTSGKSGKEGGTATKEDEEEERFMDSRGTARKTPPLFSNRASPPDTATDLECLLS